MHFEQSDHSRIACPIEPSSAEIRIVDELEVWRRWDDVARRSAISVDLRLRLRDQAKLGADHNTPENDQHQCGGKERAVNTVSRRDSGALRLSSRGVTVPLLWLHRLAAASVLAQ